MRTVPLFLLGISVSLRTTDAWSLPAQATNRHPDLSDMVRNKVDATNVKTGSAAISSSSHRRALLRLPLLVSGTAALASFPSLATAATQNIIVLRLETPQDKAGLVLQDVKIGNPARTVVAIQQVLPVNKHRVLSGTVKLQPGLVFVPSDETNNSAKAVSERIQSGPYPLELKFMNLDASNGELGEALTAQDALQMSRRQTAMDIKSNNSIGGGGATSSALSQEKATAALQNENDRFVIRTLRSSPESAAYCRKNRSQRDDVLEINYEARIGSNDGIIYDASEFRGTGRPYQMVLGSGDMIPGVDQGLYDMCVGDIRQINIPAALAYGPRGNKLFRIPPNINLVWQVELVSVDSMRRFSPDNDDDE